MKYYTLQQAAIEIGVTRKTLRNLIRDGGEHPPYVPIGKRKKFPIADLQAWINNHKQW